MIITHKLADLLNVPDTSGWTFIDGPLSESFAGIDRHGKVVISWRGENYTRQRLTLRSRLINWLNGIGNRKWERKQSLTYGEIDRPIWDDWGNPMNTAAQTVEDQQSRE